ncbi:MAG TPA: hypothetical protein VM261_32910 [Kofleriaceae bacterium]|nr:hypothetical protein [Kofleriaceae bacterium]
MRLPSLAALLVCALIASSALAACSFKPNGAGNADDDGDDDTDAAVDIDACVPTAETCEGSDQDCDGMIDEGLTQGAPCDGPDADNCTDDMTICNSQGAVVCGDTSGDDDAEVCNSADDDCDGTTDEGFMVGAQCDGADGDMCREGTFACGSGVAVCGDNTGTIVEACNGADDDCDGANDNGFDLQNDEANCGQCNTTCVATNGTNTCTTGNCVPACNNGAANCDGDPNNGCELQDTNPTCSNSAAVATTVNGDVANATATLNGTTETFARVRIRESRTTDSVDITARFALVSGAGTNYDLHVYCPSCQSIPLSDSTDDTIEIGRDDPFNVDGTFDVFVEVRYNGTTASTTCSPWTLTITGNVATSNRCPSGGGGGGGN